MQGLRKTTRIVLFLMFGFSGYLFGEDAAKNTPDQQAIIEKLGENAAKLESSTQETFSTDSLAKQYYLQGKKSYDEGKFEEALESLNKALEEDPSNIQVNYLIGKSNFTLGHYEEAVFAYERVLALDPHNQVSNLEKARAHAALCQYDKARAAFEMSLEAELPMEVRQNIELYLATFTEVSRHKFSGAVLAGVTWDSNATLGSSPFLLTTSIGELATFNASNRSDVFFIQAVIFNHQMRIYREQLFWKNSALVLNSDYCRLDNLDLRIGQVSTGLNCLPAQKVVLELMLNLMYIQLNEHLYQINPGGVFRAYYNFSPQITFRYAYSYTKRHNFQSTGRPFGLVSTVNPGIGLLIGDKNIIDFDYVYAFDKTPIGGNPAQSYYRNQITAKYTRVLNDSFNVSLGGTRRLDNYRDPSLIANTTTRHDDALSFDLGVAYKIMPNLLLEAVYRYTDTLSTLPVNTYLSSQTAINLTYVF